MDFKTRMRELMDKGVVATKELWAKTKDKARDLGEQGVLHLEVKQLESDVQLDLAWLGTLVYDALENHGKETIRRDDPEVERLLVRVRELKDRMEAKEARIDQLKTKGG